MSTKAGGLMEAIRKWKNLPDIKKKGKYAVFGQFEKGINEFRNNTMRRAYVPVKNELE